MTTQDEEAARRLIEREERGLSTPEENSALEWLATRLRRDDVLLPGHMSDWHTAAAWQSHHWPKLKAVLETIDPQDHSAIDRAFGKYSLQNGLLIDTTPQPQAAQRIDRPAAPKKHELQ